MLAEITKKTILNRENKLIRRYSDNIHEIKKKEISGWGKNFPGMKYAMKGINGYGWSGMDEMSVRVAWCYSMVLL